MKKLMIALVAVVFSAVAQAATFKWTTGALTAPNPDGTWGTENASTVGTWLAIVTLSDKDGVVFDTLTGNTSTTVNAMGNQMQGTFDGVQFAYDNTTIYNAVLELSYTADGATQTITTEIVPIVTKSVGTTTLNFKDALAAGTWTTASIPEPTSALMLLVGLAGLALKRKVA